MYEVELMTGGAWKATGYQHVSLIEAVYLARAMGYGTGLDLRERTQAEPLETDYDVVRLMDRRSGDCVLVLTQG